MDTRTLYSWSMSERELNRLTGWKTYTLPAETGYGVRVFFYTDDSSYAGMWTGIPQEMENLLAALTRMGSGKGTVTTEERKSVEGRVVDTHDEIYPATDLAGVEGFEHLTFPLQHVLDEFVGKRVRITIEVLEDGKDQQ